jgi:hypothetical protein
MLDPRGVPLEPGRGRFTFGGLLRKRLAVDIKHGARVVHLFGGARYAYTAPLPRLERDAQNLSIEVRRGATLWLVLPKPDGIEREVVQS